jgi:hypothetical protein
MPGFQYISDIHLETRHNVSTNLFKRILKPAAPYLALCGDIGYPGAPLYEPFLQYCSENFEHVFYVAGNHEFYNDIKAIKYLKNKPQIQSELPEQEARRISVRCPRYTPEVRAQQIRELCAKYPNVHFMDKETFQIPNTNILVVGCTLWSKLDINPAIIPSFNDFNRICETKDAFLTPKTYDDWNEEHVKFLEQAIKRGTDAAAQKSIIVITHHCPTYDVISDKYLEGDSDGANSFFANRDLVSPFGKNVKAWFCGHTHGCKQISLDGTIVATNTLGYDGEYVPGFKTDAVVDIPI